MSSKSTNRISVSQMFASEEISIIDLIRLFTDRKKYLFWTVGLFVVIGILIAVTSPYEYQSQSRILSENGAGASTNNSIGQLGGLLGLSGGQFGSNEDGAGLSADMYPEIISSDPFLIGLMEERFFFQEKNAEMSLQEYFSQERPGHIFAKLFGFLGSIPGRFFSLFEKEKTWQPPIETSESAKIETEETSRFSVVSVSAQQKYVLSELKPRLQIEADGRIITLKVKMPEPYISAQLNVIVLEKIIDYVVAYKTNKQRQNLQFINERFEESFQKFKKAQLELASFRDENFSMVTQRAKAKEDVLMAEFNLAFDVYRGLAQQREQAEIQLKKDTPLFTEFEPVSAPFGKAEPNIPRILIMFIVFGFGVGGMVILGLIIRDYFRESKSNST